MRQPEDRFDDLLTRNLLALWPAAAVAVGGGFSAGRPRLLGVGAAAALCLIGIVASVGVARNRNLQRPDWRPVAAVLGRSPASGPRAILVQHYRDLLPLSLYLPGLKFLRGQSVMMSIFGLDLLAMVFGMPRALFPALAERLGGGATLYGLLLSSVAAGAFVASLFSGQPSSGPTDPAITAWEQQAVVGSWLWLIGSFVLGVGCLLAAVQVFTKSWVGSVVMLVGSGMGGAGIASFSATFPTSSGVQLSVGPTYGLGVAGLGSVLALAALFIKETPLMRRSFPSQSVLFPAGPTYPYSVSSLGQTPAEVPVVASAPADSTGMSKFCPTCGTRYGGEAAYCLRDGTALRQTT